MRTTLDIPDAMYRQIKMRAAQDGSTVRGVALVLFSNWLGTDDEPLAPAGRESVAKFCGTLKNVDCSELEETQKAFSVIDEEMWK